ncbi:hypothetical protein Tco_0754101 [Tanacetum coccineum]
MLGGRRQDFPDGVTVSSYILDGLCCERIFKEYVQMASHIAISPSVEKLLLEDKQIPSVGVFDEVFSTWMTFGENTRALVNLGKKRDELSGTYTKILEKYCLKNVETASQALSDAVVIYSVTTSGIWQMAQDVAIKYDLRIITLATTVRTITRRRLP